MSGSTVSRALVTGASGYIGSHVARAYAAEGWDVHVVARPNSNLRRLQDIESRLTVHIHDGTSENLVKILGAVHPEVVAHLAALPIYEHDVGQIVPLIQSNVLFGTQLLEAMSASGVNTLVNAGTFWQHYANSEYDPVCLYAATKQAFEAILTHYVGAHELRAITLTLFDTYGPDDDRPKLLNTLARCCRAAGSAHAPIALTAGEQIMDLVHVDDVASAFVVAARLAHTDQSAGHRRFAVPAETRYSLRAIVELIQEIGSCSLPIEWGSKPYRRREVMSPWDRGIPLPGWKASVPIRQGLHSIVSARSSGRRTHS